MTLEEQIMKLQTYKMFEGEDTVYVERDNVLELLEQEPCEDAISRQAVRHILNHEVKMPIKVWKKLFELVDCLPPVTPQQKIGHWIEHPHEAGLNWEYSKYECSECHYWAEDDSDYCPDCGAKMAESECEE